MCNDRNVGRVANPNAGTRFAIALENKDPDPGVQIKLDYFKKKERKKFIYLLLAKHWFRNLTLGIYLIVHGKWQGDAVW
jgi:hypothetical protein